MVSTALESAQGAPAPSDVQIPRRLVREHFAGRDFYYPGVRKLMNKTKKLEDVMADSTLQWLLKNLISKFLDAQLPPGKFWVGAGEAGLHLKKGENFGLDIAVFERATFQISGKYASVPPVLVVEVDLNVEIELENEDEKIDLFEDYVLPKIERLLAAGVQRVIWVFTKSRRVFVAEQGINWHFVSWQQEVEFLDGAKTSVSKILENAGIQI